MEVTRRMENKGPENGQEPWGGQQVMSQEQLVGLLQLAQPSPLTSAVPECHHCHWPRLLPLNSGVSMKLFLPCPRPHVPGGPAG